MSEPDTPKTFTADDLYFRLVNLERIVSQFACMVGLAHPEPRFRLWARRHLRDFWEGAFGFEIDTKSAEALLAQDK